MAEYNWLNQRFILYLVLIILGVCNSVLAQDTTKILSIDEAVSIAVLQNKNITLAKLDERIAASNYKQTDAVFLPQVNASYTAFSTNSPLNAFGFKLEQQNATERDFAPVLLNHPGSSTDFMTQLMVQQPIVNMDMLFMRKSAQKQTELQRYKTQRTSDYITWQVKQAYLQLQMMYDAKSVLQQSLNAAQATLKFTTDRYNQGLLQKYDVLNVQVQVKTIETTIAETESNIKNICDQLSLLMNRQQGIVYKTTASALATQPNLSDSLPASRADFRAMETALQSYDLMIKSSRMSYLPKLNAFANYQLHDRSMLGFGGTGYLAGIQLSWDIFKGFHTKNKINTQLLERSKLAEQLDEQKDESRTEINKTSRAITDAAFKITQQQEAVGQASEVYRILQNRYNQGLVNTTDVLLAQTQLSRQQLALAQAVFAKNSAVVYLEFLTSVTNNQH
jgi:outer membrane protein TolC